jgi:hypothetical protein
MMIEAALSMDMMFCVAHVTEWYCQNSEQPEGKLPAKTGWLPLAPEHLHI